MSIRLEEPSAVLDKEPSAVLDKEPSAAFNEEPSAVLDKEPSAAFNEEPSAAFNKEPSAAFNKEPSAVFNKEPSAAFNEKPSAAFNKEPSARLVAAVANSQAALRTDILVGLEHRIGLSRQTGACRMIGAMDLAMTIAATSGEQVAVAAVESGAIGKLTGMTAAHMALLAEERCAGHKHRLDGGAVRLMTQAAVLCDGIVFK